MTSPPPTPSSLPPAQRSQWRFFPVTVPTEWVEDYRPGKFHPVHLGDWFKDGRYRVLRKLGYGAYSTIWLARDEQIGCYVALKILTVQSTVLETESSILRTIAQSTFLHRGKKHIMSLQAYFKHKGPNGEHGCLVFEVMGPSTASMVKYLPESLVSKMGRRNRYPIWMAKSILRQTLLSIDFLHASGISHGDLQPGNLFFSVTDLISVDEIRLSQQELYPTSLQSIERLDRKIDLWAPKHLAPGVDRIQFFTNNPPKKLVTPAGLRCPETILGKVPTPSQDIWSFGCLVFEFITGRPLFTVDTTGDEDEMNDDHFLQLFNLLGPLPRDILSKWARSDVYFDLHGENIKSYIGELPEGFYVNDLHPLPRLEELFDQEKSVEMRDEDSKQIKHILRWILQYDDTKRPSASQLLNDPWFLELNPNKSQAKSDG